MRDRQESNVLTHRKSTAYISLKLGYWILNTRKYVRCARTFYLFLLIVVLTTKVIIASLTTQKIIQENLLINILNLSLGQV